MCVREQKVMISMPVERRKAMHGAAFDGGEKQAKSMVIPVDITSLCKIMAWGAYTGAHVAYLGKEYL